jgi:hypothetical protein
VNEPELALRRAVMESFAATGTPPAADDAETLRALADQHVVVLDEAGQVAMAHPFAAHRRGARVDAGGRTWWANCAWDAFGIVAALGLDEALVTDASGATVAFRDGRPADDGLFHVAVPAREWWADIGFT